MLASSRSSAFGTLFQLSQRWVGSQYSTATSALEEPLEPLDSYGMSNFDYIRMNDLWYVDKTRFIPIVEKLGQQLFFVRPPRFGKTLFLSTMWSYYDIAQADYFDDLFKGLDIHRNPTPLRNAFYVLQFDLSDINTTSGDPAVIDRMFRDSINSSIKECCLQYKLDPSDIVNPENSSDSLRRLALKFQGKNLMVLIDEYDRFANTLMFENPGAYDKIVRGTSGDPLSSPLRSFLTNLKSLTSRFRFNRFRSFITGITPLALADTSGYNVAKNVSLDPRLGDLTGFTDDDMRQALRDIVMLSKEEEQKQALAVLRRNINGYCFPGSTTSLYNPTLATFNLEKMTKNKGFLQRVLSGKTELEDFLDTNVKTSERVLSLALKVPSSSEIVMRLSNVALATTAKIHPVFTLHQMLHLEPDDPKAHDRALSFMYYQGAVTLKTGDQDTDLPVDLRIPNEFARHDFLARLRTELALPERLLMEMFDSPSEATVKEVLQNITEKQQTLFDNTVSEPGLQHAIEAALRAQTLRIIVTIQAEKELDTRRRRCDMVLQARGKTIVLEFKRIRPNALDLDSTDPEIKSLNLPDKNNWYPEHYERLADYIKTRTPEQLEQLRIKEGVQPLCGNSKTVGELQNKAQEQLGGYLTVVSKWPGVDKVFGFVVMQIAKPLTVHKYKPPLVQDEWGKRPL